MTSRELSLYVCVAVALVFVIIASAHTTNQGAIVRTVMDPSGAVIPAVNVTATSNATGVTQTTASNGEGNYRLDFLVPGEYTITAELTGFKKIEVIGVILEVGQIRRVDVRMAVGEIADVVSVTSTAAAINTETPSLGEVIDNTKIQNLPLNGREFIQLATQAECERSVTPWR